MSEYKPQRLTVEKIVKANRSYLKSKRLGAFEFASCAYDYGAGDFGTEGEKGYRCAIGACLTPKTLAEVVAQGLNEHSVSDLFGSGVLWGTEEVRAVASVTQKLHDFWADNEAHCVSIICDGGPSLPQPLQKFFSRRKGSTVINRRLFTAWIEAVAKHYGIAA